MSTASPKSGVSNYVAEYSSGAGYNQTSASYLQGLAEKCLAELLQASTGKKPDTIDTARLNALIKDIYIKARAYKFINSFTFWFAIAFILLGTFWPLVNFHGRFIHDQSVEVSGAFQSVFTTVGGFCFGIHRQYKSKQTKIEDALRRALFQKEDIETKISRLLKAPPSIDDGATAPT